jgi:hypothetical protein
MRSCETLAERSIGIRGAGLGAASPQTWFLENGWAGCGLAKAKP